MTCGSAAPQPRRATEGLRCSHSGQAASDFHQRSGAVILKSAIFEEPFKQRVAAGSELIRGIGAGEYPVLRGYVCTTAKPRAEVPLVTEKQDPLSHWNFNWPGGHIHLGRQTEMGGRLD